MLRQHRPPSLRAMPLPSDSLHPMLSRWLNRKDIVPTGASVGRTPSAYRLRSEIITLQAIVALPAHCRIGSSENHVHRTAGWW